MNKTIKLDIPTSAADRVTLMTAAARIAAGRTKLPAVLREAESEF